MAADAPTIIASSIGFDRGPLGPYDWRPGPVFAYAADRARAGSRPRLCFVTTAVGDDPVLRAAIHSAFEGTHFEVSEEQCRPLFQRLVADDTLTPGYATDDGVALVYEGTGLAEVVADREGAAAYHVEVDSGAAWRRGWRRPGCADPPGSTGRGPAGRLARRAAP